MHSPLPARGADEQLLVNALRGDARAWSALVHRFDRFLRAAIRRRAYHLPAYLVDDVLQEIWRAVSQRGLSAFVDANVRASSYLAGFVGDAGRRVHAAHRAAGCRTRRDEALAFGRESDDRVIEAAADPNWASTIAQVDARIDVERVARRATPPVVRAIHAMTDEGLSATEAAARVGVARSSLQRQLALLRTQTLAAAS